MKSKLVPFNETHSLNVHENGFHLVNKETDKAESPKDAGVSVLSAMKVAVIVTERFNTKRSKEEVSAMRSTITVMG